MLTQKYSKESAAVFIGLSTDTKPLDCPNGSGFTEMDTGIRYRFDKESGTWYEQPSGDSGGGGGTPAEERTYEGQPPLTFESNGDPALSYTITGNMTVSGTPTPSSPIYPQECGTLVTSGDHAGQYAIPISVGGSTQTIYLSAPLRKFGEYEDVLNSNGTVTRRIWKLTLKGTESWSYTSHMQKMLFTPSGFPGYLRELSVVGVCTHYQFVANQAQASVLDGQIVFLVSSSGSDIMYLRDDNYSDAETFKAHLATLYAAGTPVCVWYVLKEESTESFTAPEIQLSKGNNTMTFNTDAQPSNVSITCMIGGGGGGGGGGSTSANKVSYSNTESGLSARTVQKAIDEVAGKQNAESRSLYGKGFEQTSGSLASGASLVLHSTNCKKNNTFSFMAKISSFSKVLVGLGFETYSGAWVEITDTKLIVHNYSQSDTAVEYTHGLTISEYIYVQIFVRVAKADVVIYSNGNTFKQTNVNWFGCNGELFAKSDGSTLTDCVFTWSCADFRKSVWIYGDSYVGLNNVARWATQLRNAGFADNVFINGYAGEASSAAVASLTNALEYYGQPEKLVWCLGMNDGADTSGSPSANYASGIAQVEALCAEYGIELIYATIPSVPAQNNEGKNAYVRSTGKRYIDFANAVGASPSGVWYTGMLSTDNVHPTEAGAIALYHRAISDCPELTFTNP